MIKTKNIKVKGKTILGLCLKLGKKNLIVLKGKKGYVMCGYLNINSANKFKEAAVIIIKVSSISQAVGATAYNLSREAKKLGIYKGQPIKDVLKIIV